ncbi:unnamed protein product [Oikopleura dioica]|uniref:Uncharacterized protein n=1 Tax=Oikopleura dioica TaxID=34765 RepID=E4XNP6_OIKDI|nr:unnamed protein product [Oikopleura dioica]
MIEALIRKYKADSNDTPFHWRLEYAGAADTADGLEGENAEILEKCQSRWTKTDRAGRHLALAPRTQSSLDTLVLNNVIKSWKKLMSMPQTPANGVSSDISRCLELKDLTDLVEWIEKVHEGDFNMDSLGKKLAVMWLDKAFASKRKTETQQELADVLAEMGSNLRVDMPASAHKSLRKLAIAAGFRLDGFWRELSIWLRRVFQTTYDWKRDAENHVDRRSIPSIIEDPNSEASTWLVVSSDPLQLALVQLDDNEEDIESQFKIWEQISKTATVDTDVRVLISAWITKVNNSEEPINGKAWQAIRNHLRPVYNEGNLRVVTSYYQNSVNQYAVDNLRKIMVRGHEEDIWEVRKKLRAVLGAEMVTDKWTHYHEIKVLPENGFLPRDFTNDLLRTKPIDYAKRYSEKGICERQECNRTSGNFVLCNLCLTQLTLISDERRGSRLGTSIRNPKKKVLARDRWTKSKKLQDVHPHLRAPILRDIIKIQKTRTRHGGVRDSMAAILAEKTESGCQKPWGHKNFKDNNNLLKALDTYTEKYVDLRKAAKWSSVQQMKEGHVIFIPLRSLDKNGLRKYEKPYLVVVEDSVSEAILLEDLPFEKDEKWVKIRVNLPFAVPEFLSCLNQYAQLLDDNNECPELVYCANFLRKTNKLEIAFLLEEKENFHTVVNDLADRVEEARQQNDYDTRYPQMITTTEHGGLEAFMRFDGYGGEVRTILRPQTKDMTKRFPTILAAESEESLVNFLAHMALSEKLVPGLHPENLLGVSTWSQSESAIGASARRQEISVALVALALDHAERKKLRNWKICDGDVVFDTQALSRHSEPSREFIEAARLSKHPNGLQILEFVRICEAVRSQAPVASQLVDTLRFYLQPDARLGKRITKKITHDWNRFMLTGYLGRKRAIVPVIREFFQLRPMARQQQRPEELPQLFSDVRSNSWYRAQRREFGDLDENGHYDLGYDSDVSDFSEGEDDRKNPRAHLEPYERRVSNVQKRAEIARRRKAGEPDGEESTQIVQADLTAPEQQDDELSVSTELFEIGEVEFTEWADDKYLENDQDDPPQLVEGRDDYADLELTHEREQDLPQSMKDKIKSLFDASDKNTKKAVTAYVNQLMAAQSHPAQTQEDQEVEENPLFEEINSAEEDAERREQEAIRAREQRYRRILCGEQDANFVDWAELMSAKNEARRYFEKKKEEETQNGLEITRTESNTSVSSVELREHPMTGPRNRPPTAQQELSQQRDRDLAREQLPVTILEELDESTTESAMTTDSDSSDSSDSEDITVIENMAFRAREEAQTVENAANKTVQRLPEETQKELVGLLKPYSGTPEAERDDGRNLDKLPANLRTMQLYDERRMKRWNEAFTHRNWGLTHDRLANKLPARATERKVSFTNEVPKNDEGQWTLPPMLEYSEAEDSEFTFGLHTKTIWQLTKKFYSEDYSANQNEPEDAVNIIPEIQKERFGYVKIHSEDQTTQDPKELYVGANRVVEMGIDKYQKRVYAADIKQTLSKEILKKIRKVTQKLTNGHDYLDEEVIRMEQRDLARYALRYDGEFMRCIYDDSRRYNLNLEVIRMSLYYGLKQNKDLGKLRTWIIELDPKPEQEY